MLKLFRFEHVNLINLLPCLYRLGTGELLPASLYQFKFLFLLIPGALPHCRGVLRRTERATAREREREQEQRGRVPSSAPTVVALPHNHTYYKNLSLGLQSPQGARFNPISVHRLLAIKAGYGPSVIPHNGGAENGDVHL